VIVGKPSRAAVKEMERRLSVASRDLLVTGDDIALDIPLGQIGGSKTVLVRSGISGAIDMSTVSEQRRPDAIVETVEEMLAWL